MHISSVFYLLLFVTTVFFLLSFSFRCCGSVRLRCENFHVTRTYRERSQEKRWWWWWLLFAASVFLAFAPCPVPNERRRDASQQKKSSRMCMHRRLWGCVTHTGLLLALRKDELTSAALSGSQQQQHKGSERLLFFIFIFCRTDSQVADVVA